MSEVTPTSPTPARDLAARRQVIAELADDCRIRCRRATLLDLLSMGKLPAEFLPVVQGMTTDPQQVTTAALAAFYEGLQDIAIWAALEPRLSPDASAPDGALWIGLLSPADLRAIFVAITGERQPTGAADHGSFPGRSASAAGTDPLDGEGVRAEAEQLAAGGPAVDVQHG